MPRKSKMRRRNIGYTETAEALTLTMPQIDLLRKVAPKRSLMAKVVEETMRTGGAMLEPRELNRLDNEVEDVETGYMSDGEIRSLIAIKKQIREAEERADFAELGYLPSGEPRPIYGKRKNKGANMPIKFKNPSRRRRNATAARVAPKKPRRRLMKSIHEQYLMMKKHGHWSGSYLDFLQKIVNDLPVGEQIIVEKKINELQRKRNPMLEMDFEEEIDDLPILANPRRNGMRRRNAMKKRRNMSKDEDARALRAEFAANYKGPGKWSDNEEYYLDYIVEKKIELRGSTQSPSEIKRIAREKRAGKRDRFKY